jgi:hypothetical protein
MKLYHLFFISQKQTFNVSGADYDAWVINSDGDDYYFMEASDPRPEGYPVRNIIKVLASSGQNDMLYYVTANKDVAIKASKSDEFAGGSDTSTASAWLSFVALSFLQKGAHSSFPAGAAAKIVMPVLWRDEVTQEIVRGTLGDWVDAGSPTDSFHIDVGIEIFGVK